MLGLESRAQLTRSSRSFLVGASDHCHESHGIPLTVAKKNDILWSSVIPPGVLFHNYCVAIAWLKFQFL